MKRILIIDDDADMCMLLGNFLQRKGFEAVTSQTGNKGIEKFKESLFDVVLCDFRLGDMDGRRVLQEIKRVKPAVVFIFITGYSDLRMAVEVIRNGAFDYISKPLIPEEVINVINRGVEEAASPQEQGDFLQATPESVSKKQFLTESEEFFTGTASQTIELYKQIDLVAPTNYSVIIYGESGTGKEVIAKTIHKKSNRKSKAFIALDCGTLSKELAASELFGHIKGSFTGALADKEGIFEVADGGTLFLDEVANLSLEVQATLLRVIQERRFKRVGSNKDITTDTRVLVASNENLQDAYRKGKFREDLYHRFNEFSLTIPPLKVRKEDIIPLGEFFLKRACLELNKKFDGFEDEVTELFLNYDWPGNLREFRNVIRRAALLSASGKITSNVLPWEIIGNILKPVPDAGPEQPMESLPRGRAQLSKDLKDIATLAEYEAIMKVLREVKYNKTRAAEVLKIDRKTLYNKIRNYEEFVSVQEQV